MATDHSDNNFFFMTGSISGHGIATRFEEAGSNRVARIVRGKKSRAKPAFFDEVSAALQFPGYFGENWDAFYECLRDLPDWTDADAYCIVFSNAECLLDQESTEQRSILLRVLRDTDRHYRDGLYDDARPRRLFVVFVVPEQSNSPIVQEIVSMSVRCEFHQFPQDYFESTT